MAHKNKTNVSPYKTRQTGRQSGPLRGTHKKPETIYSIDEASDRLRDLFQNYNFGHITHEQRRQLAHFYRLLMENQEKENFTRLLKIRDIGIKHFIDCMIVDQLCELQFPLLDMGTGPGFPGIPLKILHPDKQIILGEGVQRRVEFLKDVREKMALPNLDILGRNINQFCFYPVNGVITRAVEDVRNTLSNVYSCLQTGGCVYLMKGPGVAPELPQAEKEWGEYYKLEKDIAYTLPGTDHDRRLLIYRKIKTGPIIDPEDEPWPGEERDDE